METHVWMIIIFPWEAVLYALAQVDRLRFSNSKTLINPQSSLVIAQEKLQMFYLTIIQL